MNIRDTLASWLKPPEPPRKAPPEVFRGNYASWEEASASCPGYDAENIFAKTRDAALAVRDGKAAFERDSVLFHQPELRWEILAPLLWQAARDQGRLSVLDFGGSLGSLYFQSRHFLKDLPSVIWSVVEQKHYVEFGQKELAVDALRFFLTIEECVRQRNPNVLLLSSVLQYLPDPHGLLDQALSANVPALVLDRTPLIDGADRLTIQKVTADIYDASYPAWFFSSERMHQQIEAAGYHLRAEWDADRLPLDGQSVTFKGCFYTKKA